MHPTIVITGSDQGMWDLHRATLPSKSESGRTVISYSGEEFARFSGVHPSFQKLRLIREWLERGYRVHWIDADILVTNWAAEPAWPSPESGFFLQVSEDYKGSEDARPVWNNWSAGHMRWNPIPEAIAFIQAAESRLEYQCSGLWDQDAMQAVLTGSPEFRVGVERLHAKALNAVWPSFPFAGWRPGDFSLHLTGLFPNIRLPALLQFQKALGEPETDWGNIRV